MQSFPKVSSLKFVSTKEVSNPVEITYVKNIEFMKKYYSVTNYYLFDSINRPLSTILRDLHASNFHLLFIPCHWRLAATRRGVLATNKTGA